MDFSTPSKPLPSTSSSSSEYKQSSTLSQTQVLGARSHDIQPLPSQSENTSQMAKTTTQESSTRKRTIEELFGDIDDLLYDNVLEGKSLIHFLFDMHNNNLLLGKVIKKLHFALCK